MACKPPKRDVKLVPNFGASGPLNWTLNNRGEIHGG
jgi:hypothetical protein